MPTYYLDHENGDDANDGSDWANAWKTISAGPTAARIAAGDVIRIAKSPDPTSLGTTGAWTKGSATVTLGAAQTLKIDDCETAWTAANSAFVTRKSSGPYPREGSYNMQVEDAAFGTSELSAYYATGSLDLSSYQKITFWFYNEGAVADGDTWKICLCSDNAGATPVDTFSIPAIPSTGHWIPFTLARDGGGNLGAAIESIALYTGGTAPTNSKYVSLDNINACTTDGLNLQSLISKNSGARDASEGWYALQSIDGVTLIIDNDTNTRIGYGRGYYGDTETVTTYKRETFKTPLAAGTTTTVSAPQDSGTLGNEIEYRGGWNTATTVQDGETFFDGLSGLGRGLMIGTSKHYNLIEGCSFYRYYNGFYQGLADGIIVEDFVRTCHCSSYAFLSATLGSITVGRLLDASNNTGYGIQITSGCQYTINEILRANNNTYDGVILGGEYDDQNTIGTIGEACNNDDSGVSVGGSCNTIDEITEACYNHEMGIEFTSRWNTIGLVGAANNNDQSGLNMAGVGNRVICLTEAKDNGEYGIDFYRYNYEAHDCFVGGPITTSGNGDGAINNTMGFNTVMRLTAAEATVVEGDDERRPSYTMLGAFGDDPTDNRIYTYGALIASQAVVRHTASGVAWETSITSLYRAAHNPVRFTVATVGVNADKLVSVKAWVKLSHATNVAAKLVCLGGQIAGVPADVADTKAADTDWEELEITFTPTAAGGVKIELWTWYVSGAASSYIDDMTITQAV